MRRLAWNPARGVRVDFNDYTFVVPCVSGEGDVVVFYKVGGQARVYFSEAAKRTLG